MKKQYTQPRLLLSLLICCLSFTGLRAQYAGDLKFGVQLSPVFSGMTTNKNLINRDGSNLGLKLGLLGEYYIAENYSIHTGIGFHFNGGGSLFYEETFEVVNIWRESLDDAVVGNIPDEIEGGLKYNYDIQFLEIPLGLTLRTREFGYIKYFVRPALHLGIVTQARGTLENASFIDSEEKFDIGSSVNGVNLSWSLGAGVEYSISESTALIGGIGFQSGFADLTTDNDTVVRRRGEAEGREDDSRGRMNGFVITLGVMF